MLRLCKYFVTIVSGCARTFCKGNCPGKKRGGKNQQKTPSLKPEDFDNVQKEFDLYSTRMEKAEQDFDKIKSDTQSLLSRIEDLLQ